MNPMGIRTTTGRAHKAPADSRVTLAHIMSEHDTNLYGTIHGGVVMKLIDDAAAAAAGRHADGPAVTVSVNRMAFLSPSARATCSRSTPNWNARAAPRWTSPSRSRPSAGTRPAPRQKWPRPS